MDSRSRRMFLKHSALAAGALLLGGEGLLGGAAAQAAQTTATTQTAPPAGAAAKMAITRWQGAEQAAMSEIARKLTAQSIASLGGMQRFVSKGDVVWIKPNIGWNRTPELAANTNPDVVAELVRLCLEAGAKQVKVGDNPCNAPNECYENSGIGPAVRALGAEVVFLDRNRFVDQTIGGNRIKTIPVYPELLECDLVINVPVAKHHGSTTVSLCMKNYMGVIENRRTFHQDLPTCIADMTAFMKPQLCVVDAMRILTAHGPTGGDPNDVKTLRTVAAGIDIVALDAFGSELLGHKPADIGTVAKGAEYGLGTLDYRSLKPAEITLAS